MLCSYIILHICKRTVRTEMNKFYFIMSPFTTHLLSFLSHRRHRQHCRCHRPIQYEPFHSHILHLQQLYSNALISFQICPSTHWNINICSLFRSAILLTITKIVLLLRLGCNCQYHHHSRIPKNRSIFISTFTFTHS